MRTSLDIPPTTSLGRVLQRHLTIERASPPASAASDAFALRGHPATRQ